MWHRYCYYINMFIVNKANIGIRGSELKLYEMDNIGSRPILPIKTRIYPYCPLLPSGPGKINITRVFANPVSLIFPLLPRCGGNQLSSPPGNCVSPLRKHNSPIFPEIPPEFPLSPWISPDFPLISQWFLLIPPDSPVSCAVLQVDFVSEH